MSTESTDRPNAVTSTDSLNGKSGDWFHSGVDGNAAGRNNTESKLIEGFNELRANKSLTNMIESGNRASLTSSLVPSIDWLRGKGEWSPSAVDRREVSVNNPEQNPDEGFNELRPNGELVNTAESRKRTLIKKDSVIVTEGHDRSSIVASIDSLNGKGGD